MRTFLPVCALSLCALLAVLLTCSEGGLECPEGEIVDGACLPYDCPDRDCPEGFVCLDGRCAELACLGKDCPAGEACSGGQCYPTDCQWRNCPGLGAVCIDEECVPPGCVGRDCPEGERCAAGQCYPADCETKLCPGYDEVCVDEECVAASCVGVDCPEGELCAAGHCYPASCEELGCFSDNEVCIDDACVVRDCAQVECADGKRCANGWCYEPDCPEEDCAEVEVCADGVCVQAACVGVECDPGERCARGECLPIDCLESSCGDEEVCIDGRCLHVNCVGVECRTGQECVDGLCLVLCNGVACDPGEDCVDDACRCGGSGPDCAGDRSSTCCGTECVDLDTDPAHCDACGLACDSPPADYCDGSTAVSHPAIGDCVAGACQYPETREPCEFGCTQGACDSGLCGGETCEAHEHCDTDNQVCVCDSGWADCDGQQPGCETELGSLENCLFCGDACGDGSECGQPHCDTSDGCQILPANEGLDCGETFCRGLRWRQGVCDNGACTGSRLIEDCDTGQECQGDSCDDAAGCESIQLSGDDCGTRFCDGLDWRQGTCASGACTGSRLVQDCDGGNVCRNYFCDGATGCSETNKTNGTNCGVRFCDTSPERVMRPKCQNGNCTDTLVESCDPNEHCTVDGCRCGTNGNCSGAENNYCCGNQCLNIASNPSACGESCTNCASNDDGHACVDGVCGCNSTGDCPAGRACNTVNHLCESIPESNCHDGLDNDGDNDTDCADDDCDGLYCNLSVVSGAICHNHHCLKCDSFSCTYQKDSKLRLDCPAGCDVCTPENRCSSY